MLVTMKEILDRAKKDNYGVTSIMVDRSSLSYEDNICLLYTSPSPRD